MTIFPSARYILRFDDVTATSSWTNLSRVKEICEFNNVRPLIAVVPDNKDPNLMLNPAKSDFWIWIRERQARGWGVAMHGLTHVYETNHSGLVGIKRCSEWAGVPKVIQEERIDRGLAIFRNQNVRIDGWVAPGHSMDGVTASVLASRGIRIVSDGLFPLPSRDDHGLLWIPQQLWRFRPMPFGLWTVCFHVDQWGESEIVNFSKSISLWRSKIIDWQTAVNFRPRIPWGLAHRVIAPFARTLLKRKLRSGSN